MDSLPPYVVHEILKRTTFQDRLLTLQCVCVDWRRWTPMDDVTSLKISDFERLRANPSVWRRKVPSCEYFKSNQAWLEALLTDVIPRVGSRVKRIRFDSVWPCVNDTPPLFCAPEGFKRWTLTKEMLELINRHCGGRLEELVLTEENFVYTVIEPDAYPILASFPKLRRLAVARVDAAFGPYLRQLSLHSLSISGENAPLTTADPESLKSLQVAHPFPDIYRNQSAFCLWRHFPNLERHGEQLLVELEQLSEAAQRRRLADYRQLANFKQFRIQLGPENGARTDLASIAGYGLPKLQGYVNIQVRQLGDFVSNVHFIGQLRQIKVEGLLNFGDALALFTGLPSLKRLTLACHWIGDEQVEPEVFERINEFNGKKNASNFKVSNLRAFRLTLWEEASGWIQQLLALALGAMPSLRSFYLEEFSSDEKTSDLSNLLLGPRGLGQTCHHLKQLTCRVGSTETCKENLQIFLQTRWSKLSSLTWHDAKLHFDEALVSDLVCNCPNLRSFTVLPPGGPLRPLLPGNAVDDALCQFEHSTLSNLINGLRKLHELRLFASAQVNEELIRTIASHGYLTTVKLWNGVLMSSSPCVDSLLAKIDEIDVKNRNEGYRRRPLFIEFFNLVSTCNGALPVQSHAFSDGSVYVLANGRSYAIDEQSFFFP